MIQQGHEVADKSGTTDEAGEAKLKVLLRQPDGTVQVRAIDDPRVEYCRAFNEFSERTGRHAFYTREDEIIGKWLVIMHDARYDESGPTRLAYVCDDEQAAMKVVERHNQKTPDDSPDAPFWRAYAVHCLPPGENRSTLQDAKQMADEADALADGLLAKWDAQQGQPVVPGLFLKPCPDATTEDEDGNEIPESRGHLHRLDFCPDRSVYLDRDEAFDLFVMIDDRNGPTVEKVAADRLRAAAAELTAMAEQIDPTPGTGLPSLLLEVSGGGKPCRIIEFPDPRAAFTRLFEAENPGRTIRPVTGMTGESADLSFSHSAGEGKVNV